MKCLVFLIRFIIVGVVNMHKELVKLTDYSVTYPDRQAIMHMTTTFEANRSYAILGPSGCGKTTLLLAIADLLPDAAVATGEKQIRRGIKHNLVLQEYGLFPWKTVEENIMLPLKLEHRITDDNHMKVVNLAKRLGLESCLKDYPGTLSGGQKQRVALARAWLTLPDLLLMDEPLSALDAITREQLQADILGMHMETSVGYIIVTHSIEEAVILGETIIVMSDSGEIKCQMDNTCFGMPQIRLQQAFFDICRRVREILNSEDGSVKR